MDRIALFTTPVLVFQLDGMESTNRQLAERLVAESESKPGLVRSNVGGWHSVPDLSQRRDDCYRQLMEQIVRHVRITFNEVASAAGIEPTQRFRFGVHGWAMVMRDGDYTILHDHAESHWSVAYYADAGDADPERHPSSGVLAFVDPRRSGSTIAGVDLFPSTFTIRPHTGMLVIFPGWLQHYVHPYRGQRPRVCVSCNVQMELVGPGNA